MSLPPLSAELAQRSQALSNEIRVSIQANGDSIPFHDFMQMALYHPHYGYYSANKIKFGAEGDFITAPELTPLFAMSFAKQFIEVMDMIGDDAVIVEFGAGSGAFADACLTELEAQGRLPQAYYIIDVSADLRALQQQRLAGWAQKLKLEWWAELPSKPIKAIVFANEVLDAMPIELFRQSKQGIERLVVVEKADGFDFMPSDELGEGLSRGIQALRDDGVIFSENYQSEYNPWIAPWLASLYQSITQGAVFICDYGYHRDLYYAPHRYTGTIQCYFQHHVHEDPLIYVGVQDITAHVDFTEVASSAYRLGFEVDGYLPQGVFLEQAGIMDNFYKMTYNYNEKTKILHAQNVKKLTMATEFAENFKVMVLSKDIESQFSVFSQQNHDYLL